MHGGPAFVNWVSPVTLAAGMLYVLAPIQLFVLREAGGGRKQRGEPLTSIPPVNFQVMQRPPPFKTRQLIPLSGKRRPPPKEASVLSLAIGDEDVTQSEQRRPRETPDSFLHIRLRFLLLASIRETATR